MQWMQNTTKAAQVSATSWLVVSFSLSSKSSFFIFRIATFRQNKSSRPFPLLSSLKKHSTKMPSTTQHVKLQDYLVGRVSLSQSSTSCAEKIKRVDVELFGGWIVSVAITLPVLWSTSLIEIDVNSILFAWPLLLIPKPLVVCVLKNKMYPTSLFDRAIRSKGT